MKPGAHVQHFSDEFQIQSAMEGRGILTSAWTRGAARDRGVTIVELMVALAILALLLTLGIPSLSNLITDNRLTTQTNDMVGTLQFARSESIKRGEPVTVCSSGDELTCSGSKNWSSGWIVFTDSGAIGEVDGTDQILRVKQAQPGAVAILGDKSSVRYVPSGAIR